MAEIAQGTLVTYNPKTVGVDDSLEQLWRVFQQVQVRHLPVVDRERRVVGMVSQRDLATAMYRSVLAPAAGDAAGIDKKRVCDIMAQQVMTLEQIESPEAALRAMVAHGFHAVPVTEAGRLVGIITSTDFLREFSGGQWEGYEKLVGPRMGPSGKTVDATDLLSRALEVTEEHAQEFVVVVRRNRPLGILSRSSLRQFLCGSGNQQKIAALQATPVHLLLRTLPALTGDVTLCQAALRMLEYGARALPVVDRSRMLIGVIHEDDILRAMVEHLDQ